MQTLTHVLSLCSVILEFLGIFDNMLDYRLDVTRWAITFPRFPKYQQKKILFWQLFDNFDKSLTI